MKHSVPVDMKVQHCRMWQQLVQRNPDANVIDLETWAAEIVWAIEKADTEIFMKQMGLRQI